MTQRLIHFALLLFFLKGIAGCGHTRVVDLPEGLRAGEHGRIVRVQNGELVRPSEAITSLSSLPVVYIAERHDEAGDHRIQSGILRALTDLGHKPSIVVEWLPFEVQSILDRYLAGEVSESEFLERAKWDEVWGYPFGLYRAIFQTARKEGLRMVAANVPRHWVRAVAQGKESELEEEERALLPPLTSGNPEHKAHIQKFFKGHGSHGHSSGNFESFYRAQLVWDEALAEAVIRAKRESEGIVLVFAGRGHVEFGFGIPERAGSGETDFAIVLPVSKDELLKRGEQLGRLGYPAKPADFLWEHSTAE